MKSKMIFAMLVLALLIGAIAAYQLVSFTTVTPANVKPTATPTFTVTIGAEPTADTTVFVDEAECRAACHIPDPNEHIADGAKPQPASHQERTTCLVCHATHPKPVLPPSHVGRMDPSCAICHKPVASAK